MAEVSSLPDADQEQIGRQLLSHVEKLRHRLPSNTPNFGDIILHSIENDVRTRNDRA